MKANATSFATFRDLVNYIRCLLNGKSETACYNFGDNGTGAWGDVTAQVRTPMVALPPSALRAKWGSTKAGRGKKVRVLLEDQGHEKWFNAIVGDISPEGVIDLNPAALDAAGLPIDTELDCDAEWEWAE